MKVSVGDFREQIEACEERMRYHWQSCVTDNERINWFVISFRAFTCLREMVCPRAKQSDIDRMERVFDQFATFSAHHEQLWLAARRKEV